MINNIKIIGIVIATFLIAFLTSLLLEVELFKNPVRYALIVFLVVIELLFGFIVLRQLLTDFNLDKR